MKSIMNTLVWCLAAAVGGMLCIILPPYLIPGGIQTVYTESLFPAFATAWENLTILPTLGCFFGLGFLLGLAHPSRWLLLGCATIAAPPILAICEMIVSPTSHNLWPLEFLLYGVVNSPSLLGAFLGSRLGKMKKKITEQIA
jgi:hypothetical protein